MEDIRKIPLLLFFLGAVLTGCSTGSADESGGSSLPGANDQSTGATVAPTTVATVQSELVSEQIIGVEYQNLTIDCSGSYLMGTLDVLNSGNVPISGRVEVPVETKENFMVPLSGVFLDVPASAIAKTTLETTISCRKDQKVGEPLTVFTIPSMDKIQKLDIKDAFEWSDVRVNCDYQSTWVRLEATVKNVSAFELTTGFEAYVQNGPLSEGQKKVGLRGERYLGSAYKIQPGESRKIKFGYGDFCLKGMSDGPYTTEFETVFTY